MKRKHFVIVGLGSIGRDLVARLPKDYELVCIDNASDAEERAMKVRGDGVTVLRADGTSRLVLEEADVNGAEAVIVSTTWEKVNLEVARILKEHFHPKRVIAIGSTSPGIDALEKLGAEVLDIFATSAATIRNMLEQRAKTAMAIGVGKNEILEVEVHPHSRLARKQLGSIAPIRWKAGLIYRNGDIIVPEAETTLEPRDRVVILGDPAVLKIVSEIITFSFQKFPLEYGSDVLACLAGDEDERYFAEIGHLFDVFPLERIVFAYSSRAAGRLEQYRRMIAAQPFRGVEERVSRTPFFRTVIDAVKEDGAEYGMIVLSRGALKQDWAFKRKRFLTDIVNAAACPVLIPRGTFPYGKSAVTAVEGIDPTHALETALEVAASLNNEVSVLLVRPSPYIAADEEVRAFDAARKSISDVSFMYRADVDVSVLAGNPIRALMGVLPAYRLLYVETKYIKQRGWLAAPFDPDVVWHLLMKSPVTTMLVPHVEESL